MNMLKSKELREKMKECLSDVEEFTTIELKEMLNDMGCVYNVDYEVNAFSNALFFLVKKKFVASQGIKGAYRVLIDGKNGNVEDVHKDFKKCKNESFENEASENDTSENDTSKNEASENDTSENEKNKCVDEVELKKMRNKIKKCIGKDYAEIEQILDSEKPSVFGRNRKTYDDILELLEYMKNFKFTVDE